MVDCCVHLLAKQCLHILDWIRLNILMSWAPVLPYYITCFLLLYCLCLYIYIYMYIYIVILRFSTLITFCSCQSCQNLLIPLHRTYRILFSFGERIFSRIFLHFHCSYFRIFGIFSLLSCYWLYYTFPIVWKYFLNLFWCILKLSQFCA